MGQSSFTLQNPATTRHHKNYVSERSIVALIQWEPKSGNEDKWNEDQLLLTP
jgi:hypothetical protein